MNTFLMHCFDPLILTNFYEKFSFLNCSSNVSKAIKIFPVLYLNVLRELYLRKSLGQKFNFIVYFSNSAFFLICSSNTSETIN